MTEVLLVIAGFLCGSIPFGLLIAKSKGVDIRTVGSGNIGASNVGRVLGKKYFFLCFGLDLLKGLLPTLVAGHVLGRLGEFSMPVRDAWVWLAVMVSPVLGHVFTPWLKFRGGKGVATGLGALLGVFPVLTVAGAGAFIVWLCALAAWRYISVASILAGVVLPGFVALEFAVAKRQGRIEGAWIESAWPFLVVSVLLAVLVVWTHRGNIKRLRSGTEMKVGKRVKA